MDEISVFIFIQLILLIFILLAVKEVRDRINYVVNIFRIKNNINDYPVFPKAVIDSKLDHVILEIENCLKYLAELQEGKKGGKDKGEKDKFALAASISCHAKAKEYSKMIEMHFKVKNGCKIQDALDEYNDFVVVKNAQWAQKEFDETEGLTIGNGGEDWWLKNLLRDLNAGYDMTIASSTIEPSWLWNEEKKDNKKLE